jgi:hypothetical protein
MNAARRFCTGQVPVTTIWIQVAVWGGIVLFCGASLLVQGALAQNLPSNSIDSSLSRLNTLNASRIGINNTAMLTLGGWAAGNILVNGLAMTRSDGSAYYFQQMNLFWNIVNLGIAGAGFWGTFTETPDVYAAYSLYQSLDKQASIESLLLLNGGLDVAYMLGGAWMLEYAKTVSTASDTSRWQGYGQSLLLQGAFLLAFDATVYFIQHSTNQPLIQTLLQHTHLGMNAWGGIHLGLVLRL